MPTAASLGGTSFLVRRKVLKIFGGAFHVYDSAGNVVLYSKMKAFRLKEDVRLYTGEDMTQEVLTIQARSIIDFGATYDVIDSAQRVKVGALRRKGMKSLVRDEWLILDADDREMGMIQEESAMLGMARRLIEAAAFLFPQKYLVTMGGRPVAEFKQTFNPIVYKLQVNVFPEGAAMLDRRLALAAAIMMAAVEGKQQ
jgi:uncharacterized protein YxjI